MSGVQGDHPPAGVWGRAPNSCAAAQNASVSSGRRSQETRLPSNLYGRMTQPGEQRARRRKPPGRGRRNGGGGVRAAGRAGMSWREHWDGVRGFGVSGVTGAAECGRWDEPGCRGANTGTDARLWRRRRDAGSGVRAALYPRIYEGAHASASADGRKTEGGPFHGTDSQSRHGGTHGGRGHADPGGPGPGGAADHCAGAQARRGGAGGGAGRGRARRARTPRSRDGPTRAGRGAA